MRRSFNSGMASSFRVAVVLVACVCRAAAQEVSLTVQISDDVERTLFVPADSEPEGEAKAFCSEWNRSERLKWGGEQFDECVKELSKRVLMERLREALPLDAQLASVSVDVAVDSKGTKRRFEHVESNDIGTEAKAFCTEILSPGSKADARITRDAIEQCAGRIIAAARGKLIEQAVESEGDLGL